MARKQFELSGGVWREKRRLGTGLYAKLALAVVAGSIAWGVSRPQASIPVALVAAERKNLDLWLKSVGNVQASQSVQVAAQAGGVISEIHFTEGQEVKQGDVLARLDPSLYRAELARAKANKQQDEAQLAAIRQQLKSKKLAADKKQSLANAARQFEAAIKSDEAAIAGAEALLAYTTITAPVDGRAGIRQIDAGNMVKPGDMLVEITRMAPVSVVFSLPDQNLPALSGNMLKSGPVRVTAHDVATGSLLAEGSLELADNQVDPASGALKMKARFGNENRRLWPGAMVRVQVNLGQLPDALVVPVAALVRRGQENYVYQVDAARKTATLHPVKLLMTQGDEAVIAEGLKPGDQLAVEGATMMADSRVQVLGSLTPAR